MHWRHDQLSLRMLRASMGHHTWQSRTSVGVQTDEVLAATRAATPAPSPVIEYMTPGHDVSYAALAPVIEHSSVASVSRVNCDTHGLVNPHFSTARQVILQEIPEVQVIERTREHIALAGQFHQKQIVAGETTQNIVGSLSVS